ncbi:metallophosphoesterase [Adhaeribacter soli]|uniref:T9SS type A sorting domain-containing protein n=1 Tax=Adhaeribacter soli TaxID=2607655 RepID=A0A5N1J6I9_9BACT|nr:metallophosphoesterase [Adhaeribacter soli]KAA9340223.1 T9SS type A sorting domain-containing protein [Adhaeribacter soli]
MRKFTFLLILILLQGFYGVAQVTLVPFGSAWKYKDNGSNQGLAWQESTFSDLSWKNGIGKFGYGITDAATPISYGPDPNNKYITTYFRKTIAIPDINKYGSFTGSVKRDDGVRVFVNGKEVFRNNLPSGTVNYLTTASSAADGFSAYNFTINRSGFINGNNVIAVEVHQRDKTSNDMAFDFRLVGNPVTLTRGPYLQMGSQTGVTLRWRTNAPTNSRVEVGTVYGTYPIIAANSTVTTEHEVRVNGLVAGTRYFYRIGSTSQALQGAYSNQFKTAPMPTSTDKVRIAVFGDCGLDASGSQAATLNSYLKHVGSNPAEILLLLGDNAYDSGTDGEYQKNFFKPYGSTLLKNHIIFPTPGNHDYGVQSSRSDPYYKIFSMPAAAECGGVASGTKAFYSYDWGNIHFISLDSYGTESPGSTRLYDTLGTQVQWLKKDLAANTKKWVIAYWHHPPYSMGTHNSDTEDQMVKIRQNFIRILERGGVDLVLCGHSHVYERSYLLNNYYSMEKSFNKAVHAKSSSSAKYDGTTNSCPYIIPTGGKNHGTLYVVSGSAGGADGQVASAWPHNAMPFSFNRGGMLYLEVKDNRLDGKFLRQDGLIADQFTLMQNVSKTSTKTIAANQPIQLKASWIGNYQWSTGQTDRSITVAPNLDTEYWVTDGSNCLKDVFRVKVISTARQTLPEEGQAEDPAALPRLFPTQVQSGTSITVEAEGNEEVKMLVIDSNGMEVSSSVFRGTTAIETGHLASGIYLVKIWGKSASKTRKFIVLH